MNGYIANKQFNQPYVHYLKKSFTRTGARFQSYSKQIKTIKENSSPQFNKAEESAIKKAILSMEGLVDEIGKIVVKEPNIVAGANPIPGEFEKEVQELSNIADKLTTAIKDFMEVPDYKKSLITSSLDLGLKQFDIIQDGDSQTNATIRKLITDLNSLQSAAGGDNVTKGLTNALNELNSSFSTLAADTLAKNAIGDMLKTMGGNKNVEVTNSQNGFKTINKSINKSWLNANFSIDRSSAIASVSLSIPEDGKSIGKIKKYSLNKSANLKTILEKSNQVNSSFTYDMVNSITHGGASAVFAANKMKLTSELAAQSVTDLKLPSNGSYLIYNSNRLMNLSNFLDSKINSTIEGVSSAESAARGKNRHSALTQRYVRSRSIVDMTLSGVRLTLK